MFHHNSGTTNFCNMKQRLTNKKLLLCVNFVAHYMYNYYFNDDKHAGVQKRFFYMSFYLI